MVKYEGRTGHKAALGVPFIQFRGWEILKQKWKESDPDSINPIELAAPRAHAKVIHVSGKHAGFSVMHSGAGGGMIYIVGGLEQDSTTGLSYLSNRVERLWRPYGLESDVPVAGLPCADGTAGTSAAHYCWWIEEVSKMGASGRMKTTGGRHGIQYPTCAGTPRRV